MISTGSENSHWVAGLVEGLHQQLKAHGFNAIIVGQQEPTLALSHVKASSHAVLIVRFFQRDTF